MFFSPSLLSSLASLPTGPGVYLFADSAGKITYVGKAVNLKRRVSSYFQNPQKHLPKTQALVRKINRIDYLSVSGEVESLLLESRLIKKFRPFYNLISKDDKSPYYIHLTREIFPQPVINHHSVNSLAGPFLNRRIPFQILKYFRRISPYCQTGGHARKPCLYSHLGLCHPCPSPASAVTPEIIFQYQKNISRLKKLFKIQFKTVIRQLQKDMRELSASQDYERAALVRNRLQLLSAISSVRITTEEYLSNPNLIADQNENKVSALLTVLAPFLSIADSDLSAFRIEAYDVSHLSGKSPAGAMVVSVGGDTNPSQYRHFTIRSAKTSDDISMLKEVLTRRLRRTDWPIPGLIVLDGGKSQLSLHNLFSPMISLAKKDEIIYIPVSSGFSELSLPKNHPGLQLLQSLRDEAHRFSRRLHHLHRRYNIN